jgi:SAM-dependent methyltransferase
MSPGAAKPQPKSIFATEITEETRSGKRGCAAANQTANRSCPRNTRNDTKAKGLTVREGSATELPFPDNSFDVTCSFKVLAHIPAIEQALSEMARVTRPGGYILAELYNPYSFRGLLRALGPARKVATTKKESDVFTRFDSPSRAKELTPSGCVFDGARGVRIVTPAARVVDAPIIGRVFYRLEKALADTPLRGLAGFYIATYKKL